MQADSIIITFPHSQAYADWVFSDFKDWYLQNFGTEITVSSMQLDSTAAEEQVATWNGSNPQADIIWGGGDYNFELLRNNLALNLLEPYMVAEHANYTANLGGAKLYDNSSSTPSWYASAIDGYGFMYNTQYLAQNNLSIPKNWINLVNYSYYGHIIMTDPSTSGSTTTLICQLLQYMSSTHGTSTIDTSANATEVWQFFNKLAGNVGEFTTSSSKVPVKVAAGDYGIGLVQDFYSWDQYNAGYPVNLSFGGARTVTPDPVAIIHNTPHLTQAERFMDYITSTRGQSRVGKYRIPANFKATTPAGEQIQPAFNNDGTPNLNNFPVITPYDKIIEGQIFGRGRALFSKWFVANTQILKTVWDAMWNTNETLRNEALQIYLKFPKGLDGTLANLLSQDYHNSTITDSLASDGATNFNLTKIKVLGYVSNNTSNSGGSENLPVTTIMETTTVLITVTPASNSQNFTTTIQTPGFEFYAVISILASLVFVKRKKMSNKK